MADDDLDLEGIDPEDTGNPDLFRRLRQEISKRDKNLSALAPAQKELAFRRAGVDIDDPLGALLMGGFQGDINDVEGIKAQWATIQAARGPAPVEVIPPASEQQPAEEEVIVPSGSAERRALTEGAPPAGVPVGDFVENALNEAGDYRKKGAPAVNAAALLVNRMANGLMSGEMAPTLNRDGRRIESQ